MIEWPFITLIASFLASLWVFNFPAVLLLGWIEDIIGDLLYFCIGRFGIKRLQKSKKKDIDKHSTFLVRLENLVHSHLFLSIFVVKFTPYVQPIGLTFIGKTNIQYWRYILYSVILCIPTPLIFGMVWYHIGRVNTLLQNYNRENILLGLIWAITVLLICTAVGYYLIKKSKKVLNLDAWQKI